MDGYVSFSQLNDFSFCLYSLYVHTLYESYKTSIYHDTPQTEGKAAHETIDDGTYKRKGWVTSMPLCSPSLQIFGKCDLFHPASGVLVERKRTIRNIYDGQKFQVWAQALCLIEMGYVVREIYLHSLTDNIRHTLPVPDDAIKSLIQSEVKKIQNFTLNQKESSPSSSKCAHCIYATLCPIATLSNSF